MNDDRYTFYTGYKNVVLDVLKDSNKWKQSKPNDAILVWADLTWIKNNFDNMKNFKQKINHFQNHFEISRKDLLNKNLERFYRNHLKYHDSQVLEKLHFWPKTFVLPNDYQLFSECKAQFEDFIL